MRVFAVNKATHEISGIVYVCGEADSEGDIIEDPQVLQDAAFEFMAKYSSGEKSLFNIDHDDQKLVEGIKVVESFFTEAPTIHKGTEIPKHAWILTLQVPENLWPMLSKTRGYSMQGYGEGVSR